MSSKHPVSGKPIASGFRLTGMYATTPLEFKVLSPTGVIISRNMGGVGLGIVAALENVQAKKAGFGCRSRIWSHPTPVNRSRPDHTIVNSNKPNKSRANSKDKGCIFTISPARFGVEDVRVPQPAGFLNSCHLCNKRLHGKDIYMYSGEKAFCSPECRSRQIAMDERPEKYCSTQASSSGASRVMATGIFAI